MSVSRVFLMFMSLCVGFASCVKDPDPSLHSAPEILNTTFSVEGLDVQLRCCVSRSDNIKGCGFYFGDSMDAMNVSMLRTFPATSFQRQSRAWAVASTFAARSSPAEMTTGCRRSTGSI